MRIQITLSLLFITLTTQFATAQKKDVKYGIKAGVNNFKYVKQKIKYEDTYDFTTGFGFYVGGFVRSSISDKLKVQLEILYARHQRDELVPDRILIMNGSPFNWKTLPANYQVTENIIQMPFLFQRYLTDKFYLEFGPQFGYIASKKYTILDNYDPRTLSSEKLGYDDFDFGFSLGAGYDITDKIGISTRYNQGVIERDEQIKSAVFSLGFQYKM